MKDEKRDGAQRRSDERRRFLSLLTGAGALGLVFPLLRGEHAPKELSLKEADFYRDHDLAG